MFFATFSQKFFYGTKGTLINLLTGMWVTKADNGEHFGVPGTYQYFSNHDTKEESIHTSLILDTTAMETTQEILLVRSIDL